MTSVPKTSAPFNQRFARGLKQASALKYTDLLKEFGQPSHPKVVEYRELFQDDPTFQKRAALIDELYVRTPK